jgi:hypothetical protein
MEKPKNNSKELKNEICNRLQSNGYTRGERVNYSLCQSYMTVLKIKEEIDNSGREFYAGSTGDIPDDMFEDAMGWLNQLLPYR